MGKAIKTAAAGDTFRKLKITNDVLANSRRAIGNLAALKGLDAKTLYWLGKTVSKLTAELKAFDETREKLIEEHVERDPDGKKVFADAASVKLKDSDAFSAAMKKLRDVEIEIEVQPVLLADLGEKPDLVPGDFADLDWLIVDG